MKSPAYSVANRLVTAGFGTLASTTGWSVNAFQEPVSPDTCITVYDSGGLEPDTDEMDDRPSIQVRVRSHIYQDAYEKIHAIATYLRGQFGITLDTRRFASFEQQGGVLPLGMDDNRRFLLVVNFQVSNVSG